MRESYAAQDAQFALAERELKDFESWAFTDNLTLGLLVLIVLALVAAGLVRLSLPSRPQHGDAPAWAREVYAALDVRNF